MDKDFVAIIDDDFISPEEIKQIQDIMYANPNGNFPWVYLKETAPPDGIAIINVKGAKDTMMMVHVGSAFGDIRSPFHNLVVDLTNKFCKKHNISIDDIYRIKGNLMPAKADFDLHRPHVDDIDPHLVFLYYVNDSEGETILYEDVFEEGVLRKRHALTEKTRISPKAGRGIIFNGLRFHASTSPVNNPMRVVINVNFHGKLN